VLDPAVVARKKSRVAALSVGSNALLVTAKLAVGLYMGSVSVISEAIHSGIDLVAAIIAFFAVRAAARPADREHPFGHGKAENVSGTVEAALIFVAAAMIAWEAVDRLIEGAQVEAPAAGLVVMALSVVLNTFVSRRLFRVARETDSVALEADALHLSTDVWTSLGIFVGIALIWLTGWQVLDPIAAIAVALLIVYEAWLLVRRAFGGLMDTSLSPGEIEGIRRIVEAHRPAVVGFHELRTRRSGAEAQIDLHLLVPSDRSVEEAHAECDAIEAEIRAIFRASHVLIHVEPCTRTCPTCDEPCPERRASPATH
jgi:cation diffusion facilitator family transporter